MSRKHLTKGSVQIGTDKEEGNKHIYRIEHPTTQRAFLKMAEASVKKHP